MRRSILLGVGITFFVLWSAHVSQAQTTPSRDSVSKEPPVIQELLVEVRQLRIALQHMSINAYRGQILLERLRLQRERVGRATRELSSVRSEIGEIKGTLSAAKERLNDAEKQFDKGVMSTASVNAVRQSFAELKRREEFLNEREAQLSIEVDAERANLNDINKRLDALEREIVTSSLSDDPNKTIKK